MPKFTAPISVNPHMFKEAFSLSVEVPLRKKNRFTVSTAYIVEEAPYCVIAKEMAQQYNPAIKEGSLLAITMIEEDPDTHVVHRYPLMIPVKFAKTTRPDYIHITRNRMDMMFMVEEYEPAAGESKSARRLDLRLRSCVAVSPDQAEDELVEV